jgi:hypothetical protein
MAFSTEYRKKVEAIVLGLGNDTYVEDDERMLKTS